MSKIVNGTIVPPGQDLEAGVAGSSAAGSGQGRTAKAYAAMGERLNVCGRDMPVWQVILIVSGFAVFLGGLKALFYVAIGAVVYTGIKAFGGNGNGNASQGSGSRGGRPGGGGGGPGRGRRGPNIKGVGDLPKPVSRG